MGRRGPGAPPLEVRFWEKVEKTGTCWNWTGSTTKPNGEGYGQIAVSGRIRAMAHRVSYEWSKGPIPEGMFLDHTCHNRKCVNPDHLRVVTTKQNAEHRIGANRHNKSSGVRNVTWFAPTGKWLVNVGHNGRKIYGGLYDTIEEAAEAAKALRNRLFTHNDADRKAA